MGNLFTHLNIISGTIFRLPIYVFTTHVNNVMNTYTHSWFLLQKKYEFMLT